MILKKGSLIHEETPFIHVLSSSLRKERCEHCFEKAEVHKCSGCRYAGYCDRTCQKAAWPDHKEECERLARLPRGLELPNAARVIARIILKLKRGGDMEKGWFPKNQFRVFKDLMSHYSDIKEDEKRIEHLISLKGVLYDYLGEDLIPNGAELMGIYGRMVINAFNILDQGMNDIGTGIYLGASTIDHSCKPNSVAVFQGTTIYIRTIQDIPDYNWNKVRISYIDMLKSKSERHADLKKQYFFTCDCSRCKDPVDITLETALLCPNTLCGAPVPQIFQVKPDLVCPDCNEQIQEPLIKRYVEALEFTKEQHLNMKDIAYLDVCKVCLNKQDGCFYPLNIYRTKTLDLAFESAIKLKQWSDAVHFGQQLLPGFRRHCGPYHPLLGLYHLNLGTLLLWVDQEDKALTELNKAEEVIKISHGMSHTLYKQQLLPLLLQAKYSTPA